jgi:peptidoglycan/xylan/chitin deacetylase (PgdA/CDA1 family)
MRRWLKDCAIQTLGGLLRPIYGGVGCILSLHRVVLPGDRSPIWQNRAMEITASDLRAILEWVRRNGFDVVRVDELRNRLGEPRGSKFVCFTFDDGYRDNLTHALPVFREFGYPFAVNVTTGFVDRTVSLWWYLLEDLLARRSAMAFEWEGKSRRWQWNAPRERQRVFDELAQLIRQEGAATRDALVNTIAEAAGLDPLARTSELILSWDELRSLASNWHVTVGAHTVGHHVLAKLNDAELDKELRDSRAILETQLAKRVQHLAYPFGGRDAVGPREFDAALHADYETATTTRCANLHKEHAWHLLALPRLGVDGNYNAVEQLERLENGMVAARGNRWKRVVTA